MKSILNFTTISWLIISMLMIGFLFPKDFALAESANMCQVDVDVILVLDVSGSMDGGGSQSQCNWKELEWVDDSMQCVNHSEEGLIEQDCLAKPDTIQCGSPVYTPPVSSKIESAKIAAKSFLDNLKSQDQSGLVTFSDTAQLIKQLSSDHTATKTAIDSVVTGGATNIGDAILFAITEFNGNANPQATKTIILLTDGKANRPNGLGSGEDSNDVDYAVQKATEAGNLGYKIFTIGLGNDGDINSAMLQDIAGVTGATYHHALSGDGLEGIYQEISTEICQYASISGYKYNDLNNNGEIDDGEEALAGWEIVLSGDSSSTQTTDENGFYTFAGLMAGDYTVSEINQEGWTQTYPLEGFYELLLSEAENLTEKDFANYFSTQSNPEDYDNEQDCTDAGFYWYDDACHGTPQPGEPVAPEPGDVVINEIMQDPGAVSDTYGEWFELYNTTNYDIELSGCVIRDELTNFHTITSLILPASGYAVLAKNGDTNKNGGVNPDYVYSNTTLGNANDSVILDCDSTEIDRVEYDGEPEFPDPTGASMILGNPALDNNVGANWCVSTTPYGLGDFGTPGSLNDSCGFEPVCGNNIVESGEQCDDGNTSDGDGCSSTCQTEQGGEPQPEDFDNEQDCTDAGFYWYDDACHADPYVPQPEDYDNEQDCTTASFYWYDDSCHADPQPYEPVCGNEILDEGEQCDDGNTSDGDGCSSTCQTEQTSGGGTGIIGMNYYSTISASAGEGGSMTPLGEVHVSYLSNQFFSIEPNKAYKIKDVLVDGISVGPVDSYSFEHVTGNHTISASFSVKKIGDINRDGNVDEQDLALMLSAWGQTDSSVPADLNDDGKIDEYDMAILMLHWGE